MSAPFSSFYNTYDALLTEAVKVAQKAISTDLGTILISSFTLYFVFYGYMIWAGKIQAPIPELIWNLGKFSLILAFIQNATVLSLFNDFAKSLTTIGSGGKSPFLELDRQWRYFGMVARTATYQEGAVMGLVYWVLIQVTRFLFTIPCFIYLLIASVTTHILLAFSPLFFFALLWGWLKDSFSYWLSALLGNMLLIMTIGIISSGLFKVYVLITEGKIFGEMVLLGLLTSILIAFFTYFIANKVQGLAKVSLNKLPNFGKGIKDQISKRNANKQSRQKAATEQKRHQEILTALKNK